jgi:putative nucleotidyltransferase with HDIG domain
LTHGAFFITVYNLYAVIAKIGKTFNRQSPIPVMRTRPAAVPRIPAPSGPDMLRVALILALVGLNFVFCFVQDVYLLVRPLNVGQTAPFTLRADHPLVYPQPVGQALPRQSADAREYRPGDVVVPFLKVLDSHDVQLVEALEEQTADNLHRDALLVSFVSLFTVLFLGYYLLALPRAGYRRTISHTALLILLILQAILLKALLVFTALPVESLPFAMLPLLVIAANQGRLTAIGTCLVAAVLTTLFMGRTYGILLSLVVVGFTAVMVTPKIQRKTHIILPSVLVGLVNAVFITVLNPDWDSMRGLLDQLKGWSPTGLAGLAENPSLAWIGWAFAAGPASGALCFLLLPLMRLSWNIASLFTLRRFSDLDHPLLKKLSAEAPGTFQHSVTVAYLARSAGEAVDADTILLRIGGYYHDIGKMTVPTNFVENQFESENPHDRLEPAESVQRILDHVRLGMKLAREWRLPQRVIDLIPQHHGTQLMEYFYSRAQKAAGNPALNEEDFRYPGPKPQTIEAAILMIADAVEAASRTLKQPTKKTFDKLVRMIIVKKIADGQFSDCRLDTGQIEKIVPAMVNRLEAMYHSRILYPWQQPPGPSSKPAQPAK